MAKQSNWGIWIAAATGATSGIAVVAVANKLFDDVVGRNSAAAGRVFPAQPCGLPSFPVKDALVRSRMETASVQMSKRVAAWMDESDIEQVTLPVDGNAIRLSGTIVYAARASRDWVVLAHEYRGNRRSMEKFGEMYARRGFNVLNVDLRGHGGSQGEYITMGWSDGQDLLDWVGYLVSRFGVDIRVVLHGQSMGAVAVLNAAGKNRCPQLVAVVSDSCCTHIRTALLKVMEQARILPPAVFYALLRATTLLRCGYDLSKDNPIDYVGTCTIPVLFFHGAADTLVVPGQSAELYSACASTAKKLIVIPEAGHAGSVFVDCASFEDELFDFMQRVGVVDTAAPQQRNEWM